VPRLFLDANVLFTAAHRLEGKAAFLWVAAAGRWRLLSSAYALEEARRNVSLKFGDSLARLDALAAVIELVPQTVTPPLPLALPDKDQPIWAAALAARATHLLTGDLKDFGRHMNQPETTGGIVIQTVSQFLAQVR
jgi:hypothetical protein